MLIPRRSRRATIWIVRAACLGTWATVTALLLAPNPAVLMGLRHVPFSGYALAAHFGCFFVLGILTLASRLPSPWWATLAVLGGYGVGIELLQGLVPQRTIDFADFLANAVGIAAGVGAYAAAEWYWRRQTAAR